MDIAGYLYRRTLMAVTLAVTLVALGVLPSRGSGEVVTRPGAVKPSAPVANAERRAVGAPQFGFADDIVQHELAIGDARNIGANIGRIGIPWYFTQWRSLDTLYDLFYSNGIRPLFTLYVTPPPAPAFVLPGIPPAIPPPTQEGPRPENLPPAPPLPDVENFKPAEFAAQAAYMAQRYPYAKIQLLNEPNLAPFRSFTVEQTVEVVVLAARAIHKVAPNTRLIGPAASPDQGRGYSYTRAVYSQLPSDLDYIDAAANIYPGPGKQRAFRQIKKSWRTAARTGRRVWVTEITPGIYSPRRRRCNQIKEAFSYLKAKGAKGILFFRLREPPVVHNVQGRLWAVNADGTRTDLYRCLKKAAKRLRKPGRPGRPQLQLRVVNRTWLHRGNRVRVRFLATAREDYGSLGQGPREPVGGVEVEFGGDTARTNSVGQATITTAVSRRRQHHALARRRGYRGDAVTLEFSRPHGSSGAHRPHRRRRHDRDNPATG